MMRAFPRALSELKLWNSSGKKRQAGRLTLGVTSPRTATAGARCIHAALRLYLRRRAALLHIWSRRTPTREREVA